MDDNTPTLEELSQQMRSDNEFYCLLMGQFNQEMRSGFSELRTGLEALAESVSSQIKGISAGLSVHIANSDERMRQIEGRQRLQEQRFTSVISAVPSRQEFQSLEQRVRALEDKAS